MKGYEKAKWTHVWQDEDGNAHHERNKYDSKIIDFKNSAMQFSAPLVGGDYCLPFDFTLPTTCPASLEFADKSVEAEPKGRVQHTIKCIIKTNENKEFKYKQLMIIHE